MKARGIWILAVLAAMVASAVALAAPAQAHTYTGGADCLEGWWVDLADYDDGGPNSVRIVVDGVVVVDESDFGTDFFDSGGWAQPLPLHLVEVSVVAWDDPDGSNDWSFTAAADFRCEEPPPSSTTSTTAPPVPEVGAIEIVKSPDAKVYGDTSEPRFGFDGIGFFTIVVTNPGPVDLNNVVVTDVPATDKDATTDCPATIGDLAVGESRTYDCKVANLGTSPFNNTATAIGFTPTGNRVTATDPATLFPPVLDVTITTTTVPPTVPPTTAPPTETLPVTGADADQLRPFGLVGIGLFLGGLLLLGGAALIGEVRKPD